MVLKCPLLLGVWVSWKLLILEAAPFKWAGLCGRSVKTLGDMVKKSDPEFCRCGFPLTMFSLCVFAAEACIPYYEAYTALVLGNKDLLNALLDKFDPTDEEKEAVDKVQECYNEAGLEGKTKDVLVLVKSYPSLPRLHIIDCCPQMIHVTSNVCQGIIY